VWEKHATQADHAPSWIEELFSDHTIFFYVIDQGLANFSSVSGSPDQGRLLENAVFLEMKRSGKEIWYFKGRKECDFITRSDKNIYSGVQVSWKVGEQNENREIEGLLEAMNYLDLPEGTIITLDQQDKFKKDGKTIHLVPAWKWMG